MKEQENTTPDNSCNCGCHCKCGSKSKKIFFMFAIIILAFGVALCGWFVADGLYRIKMGDKSISVKGLAERRVKADLAVWTIDFKAASNNLEEANNKIAADQKTIIDFLSAHGVSNSEIELQQTSLLDRFAQEYNSAEQPHNRYIINSEIMVRTNKVDLIKQLSSITGELIAKGVILGKEGGYNGTNPRYVFTKLDEIRPEMLEEATKSAKMMADRFVKNSGVALGSMKLANQGKFQIFAADSSSANEGGDSDQEKSIYKAVRVVVTIEYFLR